MPLTRKYTNALEKLARASKRLATAKEESNSLLLDAIFREDQQTAGKATQSKAAPATSMANKSPKK
jgi:hypothetical protein